MISVYWDDPPVTEIFRLYRRRIPVEATRTTVMTSARTSRLTGMEQSFPQKQNRKYNSKLSTSRYPGNWDIPWYTGIFRGVPGSYKQALTLEISFTLIFYLFRSLSCWCSYLKTLCIHIQALGNQVCCSSCYKATQLNFDVLYTTYIVADIRKLSI